MLQGSLVALVTPMKPDGSIDDAALAKLIEFHLANATDGIVAVGTTGESATLPEQEHCAVMARVVELVAGRVPVIAGTGANSTSEAIILTRCAQRGGADACLLVTPYYNKPTQQGMFLHHKAIAEAVDIPQILYNVPGRTACDMLPDTVAQLAAVPNIIGIKEATGDLDRVTQIRQSCGADFALYSGDDASAREFIRRGGNGVISVTANLAPKAMHDMCMLTLEGEHERAAQIDAKLAGLHEHLFVEANPIPVKWALQEMGMIDAGIRLPLTELSPQYHDLVRDALKQAGIL